MVIGAGLAGLTSAHCLAALFDEVTLVERDDISATPADPAAATNDQAHVRTIPFPHRGLLYVLQSVRRKICDRHMFDCVILWPIRPVSGRAVAVASGHNPVAYFLMFMQPSRRSPRTTFYQHPFAGAQLMGRSRPGVPQFSQPHLLLKKGVCVMNELFGGGFEQRLIDAGAVPVNWIEDAKVVSGCCCQQDCLRNQELRAAASRRRRDARQLDRGRRSGERSLSCTLKTSSSSSSKPACCPSTGLRMPKWWVFEGCRIQAAAIDPLPMLRLRLYMLTSASPSLSHFPPHPKP